MYIIIYIYVYLYYNIYFNPMYVSNIMHISLNIYDVNILLTNSTCIYYLIFYTYQGIIVLFIISLK